MLLYKSRKQPHMKGEHTMNKQEFAYIKTQYSNALYEHTLYTLRYKNSFNREHADKALRAETIIDTLESLLRVAKVDMNNVCDPDKRNSIIELATKEFTQCWKEKESTDVQEVKESKTEYLRELYLETISTEIYRYGEYLNKQHNNEPNSVTYFCEYTKQSHARYILELTISYFYNIPLKDVKDWLGVCECQVINIKREVIKRFSLDEHAMDEL